MNFRIYTIPEDDSLALLDLTRSYSVSFNLSLFLALVLARNDVMAK